jgi:nitrate reductase NapAB chaperone NapD
VCNINRCYVYLTVDICSLVIVAKLEIAVRVTKLTSIKALGIPAVQEESQVIIRITELIRECGSFRHISNLGEDAVSATG